MLPHPPGRDLPPRKLHAVDATLLSSSNADHHAVDSIANGVGLCVLDGDSGENLISDGSFRKVLVLGRDVLLHHVRRDELVSVSSLSEHAAVDLAEVDLSSRVLKVGIGLEHDEAARLLLREDGEGLGSVTGGDDAVRDFRLEVVRRLLVHNVRQSRPVAEGAHGVSVASTEVGERSRREIVRSLVCLLLHVGEGHGDSSSCRGDVLEGGSSWEAEGLARFLDQSPGVEGIEEVDVSRLAVEDLEGKSSARHAVDVGGELMGVASVLQGEGEVVRPRHHSRSLLVLLRKPSGDSCVVGCRVSIRGSSEAPPGLESGTAVMLLHLFDHLGVLGD
mmetsp:Transcript_21658/g.71662  ORF Transcript_21658/g.71662 Transcript_21658/m.71662 type:complete len:333 (-) Transcript_21658:612-1610(-)